MCAFTTSETRTTYKRFTNGSLGSQRHHKKRLASGTGTQASLLKERIRSIPHDMDAYNVLRMAPATLGAYLRP